MGAIERVVARWRAEGLVSGAGSTPEALARLEQHLGGLPDEVRRFYSLTNGCGDDDLSEHHLCFWSIERILAEAAEMGCEGAARPGDYPIADFLLHSWFVHLRRLGPGRLGVWVEGVGLECASFEELFEIYERDPDSLGLMPDLGSDAPS